MRNALLRLATVAMLSFVVVRGVIAEPGLVWRKTIEAAGTWQTGFTEPELWCRDDARMGLADLRDAAARDCTAGGGGRVATTPVEEEIEEGAVCRARQEVVCAGATRF